jgi:hypothetical protein
MLIMIKRSSFFHGRILFTSEKSFISWPQIEIMEVFATAGKITNEVALKKKLTSSLTPTQNKLEGLSPASPK